MYKYFIGEFNKDRVYSYYLNRAFRVIPLYLLETYSSFIFFLFLKSPHEFYLVLKHYFFSAYFLPNVGYWAEESYLVL